MNEEHILAEHIFVTKFDDLSSELINITKLDILDMIAVTLAGSTMPGTKEIVDHVKEMEGRQESPIFAFGGKAPAQMAALANSVMAATRDYDDVFLGGGQHPGAPTIPAAFAVAGKRKNVSGKEFITAVALGLDLQCRLGLVTQFSNKVASKKLWHHTAILGTFGAATASAKLLELNKDQILSSWGLALSQAAGTIQWSLEGPSSRPFQIGNACRSGVVASLLAQKGFEGYTHSLGGEWGLFKTHFRDWPYDLGKLTEALGKRFEGTNMIFKLWPSSSQSQTAIEATLQIVKAKDIKPEDVERVNAYYSDVPTSEAYTIKKPPTVAEAQFSIPFQIAVALCAKEVRLKDVGEEGIKNPKFLGMAEKVEFKQLEEDESLEKKKPAIASFCRIEIVLKNGKTYSSSVIVYPYGFPENPMQKADFISKFKDCAKNSVLPLSDEKIENLIALLDNLDEVEDINQITQHLA